MGRGGRVEGWAPRPLPRTRPRPRRFRSVLPFEYTNDLFVRFLFSSVFRRRAFYEIFCKYGVVSTVRVHYWFFFFFLQRNMFSFTDGFVFSLIVICTGVFFLPFFFLLSTTTPFRFEPSVLLVLFGSPLLRTDRFSPALGALETCEFTNARRPVRSVFRTVVLIRNTVVAPVFWYFSKHGPQHLQSRSARACGRVHPLFALCRFVRFTVHNTL